MNANSHSIYQVTAMTLRCVFTVLIIKCCFLVLRQKRTDQEICFHWYIVQQQQNGDSSIVTKNGGGGGAQHIKKQINLQKTCLTQGVIYWSFRLT